MLVRDFDFELPDEAIAQHAAPRGESRLLVLDAAGEERHRRVRDLAELLRPGDLLMVNDTLLLPARLFGRRLPGTSIGARAAEPAHGGGRIELLLAERHGEREWDALLKPGRRAAPGTRIELADDLSAEVVARGEDGRFRLRFSAPVEPHLEHLGHVPLPPYIHRPDEAADREGYQTVYAREPGAIAAPTAGLHFDEALLAALDARGIERVAVTLHVGLGTFKPMTAEL